MTSVGLEADFTGCDTAALNRFFRAYPGSRGQGGTNTKQRNLRHLSTWLAIEYGHPHARDHAMIRVLTEGVRPAELVQICLDDLQADLIARPYIRVVPLKGDLMRLMGWQDRAMLDRYGANLQVQRAIEAKRCRGEMY